MRFDDRLKTAITQPVVDDHDRVVRWRQLVDLLARLPEIHDEALADAAFALVDREAPAIPEAVRAASARHVAAYPVDPRVVALFAQDKLAVAAPVLASANLSAIEWHEIARDSSPDVANFILALSRGSPQPSQHAAIEDTPAAPTTPVAATEDDVTPSISQMVARIEQLRNRREVGEANVAEQPIRMPPPPPMPQPSAGPRAVAGDAALFRWESNAEGQINWVDGVPRGAFVGQSLGEVSDTLASGRALVEREPFADVAMTKEHAALAGEWRLSGIPAFSPVDGRFLGYRGIARKPEPVARSQASSEKVPARQSQPRDLNALRETIHEIKTPLNAIIGFAEIIDGQYLGPAHRNYRQRAAEIVMQARMLLEAVQDLDLAARMQSEGQEGSESSRASDVLRALEADLGQSALRVGADLSIVMPGRDERFRLSQELAGRMLRRFLTVAIGEAQPGERLVVTTDWRHDHLAVSISRPEAGGSLPAAILLDPNFVAEGAQGDLLGFAFALRLVRGLVRLVDGDLLIEESRLVLLLPAA